MPLGAPVAFVAFVLFIAFPAFSAFPAFTASCVFIAPPNLLRPCGSRTTVSQKIPMSPDVGLGEGVEHHATDGLTRGQRCQRRGEVIQPVASMKPRL